MVASTFDELVRTWRRKHHFTLHAHRLLSGELLNKRYIEVNARPPTLSVIPVDNIRMSLNVERRAARDQLWLRMRADLTSIAFVSIHNSIFFNFDTCENAMELEQEYLYTTFEGALAPVSFFLDTYLATWRKWTDAVKHNDMTLNQVVQNVKGWADSQANYELNVAATQKPITQACPIATKYPDLPPEVKTELLRLGERAKRFQSDKDKAVFELERLRRDSGGDKASRGMPIGHADKRGDDRSRSGPRRRRR